MIWAVFFSLMRFGSASRAYLFNNYFAVCLGCVLDQRSRNDFRGARDTLDDLVAYCPMYVEGYNQRAFANYLRQDFSAALVDLDIAIEMMPNHIAAISGRGLTLMGMGRHAEAQEALKHALTLNPWLSERALIVDPIGTDI